MSPAFGIHVDESGEACAVAFLSEPRPCSCKRMAAAFINRDGETRCVECDVRYRDERAKREVKP